MKINLEDSKGQIITSYEIQEDDTLENIDGFYEIKGGTMTKHRLTKKEQWLVNYLRALLEVSKIVKEGK